MFTLTDGPPDAAQILILAHGAGGAMDTPFMNRVAAEIGAGGVRVVRFEFPYMAARRSGGRRGAPDRQPVLLDTWREVVAGLGGGPKVAIGGKSMGGRMASLVADELHVQALILLGYPFHPPRQPEKLRTAHLAALRTPTLILQGERDPFGTPEEVARYELSSQIHVEWITDGDHSLTPRARSGITASDSLKKVGERILSFLSARR